MGQFDHIHYYVSEKLELIEFRKLLLKVLGWQPSSHRRA